jgi:hypothetical protein
VLVKGRGVVRVRLSNPGRLRRLLAFLALDPAIVVSQIGASEIEVSFLGSLNEWAQRRELELRLRAWRKAHPDVIAVLYD